MYKKIAEKTYIVPETACIPRIVQKLQPRLPNVIKGGQPLLFTRIARLDRAGGGEILPGGAATSFPQPYPCRIKPFPLQEARRKRNGGTRSRIPFAAVQMTKPPFTPIVWPVMKAAPSLSRKRAAAAISSGVPSRCSGVSSASARSSSGV